MSDLDPAPDWNLLPHSPQAFFHLEEGFDRKDLKRSYNRLLRIFKPEKFPQEFQRIRGAYEQLDNQLRYGAQFSQGESARETYAWVTDVLPEDLRTPQQAGPSKPESSRSKVSRRLPLHARVQQEPLPEIYQSLSKKDNKTAYDYYALAVMSDLVHRQEKLRFARWILAGIKALPNEHGLYSLLSEYFRSPIPSETIPELLIACSEVVVSDRFFALTESLWLRMLREWSFQDFRATLEKCETQLQGISIDGRLAFSIEILKTAIWNADREWIDKTMSLIDENFERIPYHVEHDVDLLEMLKRYIDCRKDFIQKHPLRQKIDSAIQVYFSEDQQTGDLAVLEAQIAIAQNPDTLVEAFPYTNEEEHNSLFTVWSVISEDVAERNIAPPEKEQDASIWASRVHALLCRIDDVTNSSLKGVRWTVTKAVYLVSVMITYLLGVMALGFSLINLTSAIESMNAILVITVVSISAGLWAMHWVHTRVLFVYWDRYCKKKFAHFYCTLWRQEILDFLERSHLDYFELRDLFFGRDITGLTYANAAVGHFQQDYALIFYSTARQFIV